ncbi:MAG: type IV secretion system protein [Pseudomonadota bacterium]
MKHMIRLGLVLAMVALVSAPMMAQAATGSDVCTNFATLKVTSVTDTTPGLLTNITNYIKTTIHTATYNLYSAFTDSSAYQNAVNAAVTLMVIVYGVGFMIGVVQATFGETLKRLVKLGIIFTLISPMMGWHYFNAYVVTFFNDGTDELIGMVMSIGTGDSFVAGQSPFKALDSLARFVLQPDTMIAILGSVFAAGPYGFAMGGLLGIAVFGLLKMLLDALQTYAVSFVVRSLLLGVAPIFIVFLLFERTKPLFTGWLNSLINLSLQPILYFTFLSFFIVMITSASTDMLGGELCWTEYKAASGTDNKISFWRFVDPVTHQTITDDFTWQGPLSCKLGPTPDNCKSFPINIVDMLSFLILVYIAQKFGKVVENISGEISNVFVNLDKGGKMEYHAMESRQAALNVNDANATKKGK